MRLSRHNIRHILLTFAAALAVAVVQGCAPGGGGGKKGRKGKGASKKAALAAAVLKGGYSGGGGAGAAAKAEYERAYGYIVKGTDFATFWPCGKEGYYFLSADQMVNARISQQYKFATPRPFLPMYADLRLRYVNDSVSRGSRHFDRYVEVVEYAPTSRDNAKCAAPSRVTLSNEMERLDGFKVGALPR